MVTINHTPESSAPFDVVAYIKGGGVQTDLLKMIQLHDQVVVQREIDSTLSAAQKIKDSAEKGALTTLADVARQKREADELLSDLKSKQETLMKIDADLAAQKAVIDDMVRSHNATVAKSLSDLNALKVSLDRQADVITADRQALESERQAFDAKVKIIQDRISQIAG